MPESSAMDRGTPFKRSATSEQPGEFEMGGSRTRVSHDCAESGGHAQALEQSARSHSGQRDSRGSDEREVRSRPSCVHHRARALEDRDAFATGALDGRARGSRDHKGNDPSEEERRGASYGDAQNDVPAAVAPLRDASLGERHRARDRSGGADRVGRAETTSRGQRCVHGSERESKPRTDEAAHAWIVASMSGRLVRLVMVSAVAQSRVILRSAASCAAITRLKRESSVAR